MSLANTQYSDINQVLFELRREKLKRSRGQKKTIYIEEYAIEILEDSCRGMKAYVSATDICLCKYIYKQFKRDELKEKTSLDLDSGCGLVGLLLSLLGSYVVFYADKEVKQIVEANIEANLGEGSCTKITENEWGTNPEKTNRFNDIIVASLDVENMSEKIMEDVLKTLVEVSGNGSTLILGYTSDCQCPFQYKKFREMLGTYFDLRNGRQAIYNHRNREVTIVSIKRKPFSTFLN